LELSTSTRLDTSTPSSSLKEVGFTISLQDTFFYYTRHAALCSCRLITDSQRLLRSYKFNSGYVGVNDSAANDTACTEIMRKMHRKTNAKNKQTFTVQFAYLASTATSARASTAAAATSYSFCFVVGLAVSARPPLVYYCQSTTPGFIRPPAMR